MSTPHINPLGWAVLTGIGVGLFYAFSAEAKSRYVGVMQHNVIVPGRRARWPGPIAQLPDHYNSDKLQWEWTLGTPTEKAAQMTMMYDPTVEVLDGG